jgi:hypothetical protein
MSNDLQADINTKLNGQGLTQATQGIDRVKNATEKLNKSTRDLQRSASASLGTMKLEAKNAKEQLDRVNQSLQGLQGPLGEVSRKLFAAFRLGGGLGGAAAGAIVATTAIGAGLKIWNMAIDANVEKTRKQIDAQKMLTQAVDAARKGADQSAAAFGKQNDQTLRQATARIGAEGIAAALQTAKTNKSGVDFNESLRGSIAAAALPREIQGRAMQVAMNVAGTGEMSYSDALKEIAGSRFYRQLLSGNFNPSALTDVSDRLIVGARGQDPTGANLEDARRSRERVRLGPRDSSAVGILNQQNSIEGDIAQAQYDQFMTGRGLREGVDRLEKTRDPGGVATREVIQKLTQQNEEALKIERASGETLNKIYRQLEKMGLKYRIGSEGMPSAGD